MPTHPNNEEGDAASCTSHQFALRSRRYCGGGASTPTGIAREKSSSSPPSPVPFSSSLPSTSALSSPSLHIESCRSDDRDDEAQRIQSPSKQRRRNRSAEAMKTAVSTAASRWGQANHHNSPSTPTVSTYGGPTVLCRLLFAAVLLVYGISLYPVNRIIWISATRGTRNDKVDIHCSVQNGSSGTVVEGEVQVGDVSVERLAPGFASSKADALTVAPGELPGYTGWARPEHTVAGYFEFLSGNPPSYVAEAGKGWSVDVRCGLDECRAATSKFYLRAYGPGIITGEVEHTGEGSYRMSFYPVDPGLYTVEVVLDFSDAPDFKKFPFQAGRKEPGYEGYLLPGFPAQIKVIPSPDISIDDLNSENEIIPVNGVKDICKYDQLLEEDARSGIHRGRWRLVDNIRTRYHTDLSPNSGYVSLLGYQHGLNSIGLKFMYDPNECSLLSYSRVQRYSADGSHLIDQCFMDAGMYNDTESKARVHVIFVGDSSMRIQSESFHLLIKRADATKRMKLKTTLIDMKRGLFRRLPLARFQLERIRAAYPNERRFVIFNSGLHDIDRLCSSEMSYARGKDQQIMNFTVPSGVGCVDVYEILLSRFVRYLSTYPAEKIIFRSTTAGWLKYGNYGFAWPTEKFQPYSRSSHFTAKMNEVAFDVIEREGGGKIDVTDGYWMSLARPDHTEFGAQSKIGKHLVHMGVEVMDTMARVTLMLVLRTLCSETLDGGGDGGVASIEELIVQHRLLRGGE